MNALSAPVSGRSIVSWARASRDLAGLQCLHSAVLHQRLSGLLRLVVCLCSRGLSELWLPAHLSQVGPWWPAGPFLRGPAALGLRPRSAAATGWAAPARPGLPVPRCPAWSRVPPCSWGQSWAPAPTCPSGPCPPAALDLRPRSAVATGWVGSARLGLPVPWAATRVATRPPAPLGLCPRSAAATGWVGSACPGLPVPWAATRVATRPPVPLDLRPRSAVATGWVVPVHSGLPVPWAATRVATRPPATLGLRPRSAAATGWAESVRLGLPVPRCPAWLRAPPCCSA